MNNNDINLTETITQRTTSEGAEKWIRNPIPVLDHGFVYLVDYMGNDLCVEEAARVSYGPESKKVSSSTGLLRYLVRHRHTSPLEMVELKFHLKMPMFVARQWIRHRTASLNEISGRYSVLPSEFYIPDADDMQQQSNANNQGRGEMLPEESCQFILDSMSDHAENAYQQYLSSIEDHNLAKEIARSYLPLNIYTEFYWKIDMHNLLHFLKLRLDSHAQLEIRRYAEAIQRIVRDGWPLIYEAFEDYSLGAESFSQEEVRILRSLIDPDTATEEVQNSTLSARERLEFFHKINSL